MATDPQISEYRSGRWAELDLSMSPQGAKVWLPINNSRKPSLAEAFMESA